MQADLIREKYLNFFKSKRHVLIPAASLIPKDDSVLFTTAGMQPLMPYLKGKKHPLGKRLVNFQKCVRTDDIDEVGDFSHHTFFEMLGNWSLGDYFKEEAIDWSYQFLTGAEWLGLNPAKLYVSVFKGGKGIPYDEEAAHIWKEKFSTSGIEALVYGVDEKTAGGEFRIFPLGEEDNWWELATEDSPCGPDSEVFYYREKGAPDLSQERPGFNSANFVELWNNVFMEYNKTLDDKNGEQVFVYEPLKNKNVDTGAGLERLASITEKSFDDYKTDVFAPLMEEIEEISPVKYGEDPDLDKSIRIIADHVRAVIFIIADEVLPSNLGRGYILRRLLRRIIRHFRSLRKLKDKNFVYHSGLLEKIVLAAIKKAEQNYPQLKKKKELILKEIKKEEIKFGKTLEKGLKEFEKIARVEEADNAKINGAEAFNLYQTYGFPIEMTEELAGEREMEVDRKSFDKKLADHKNISRRGMEKKFKGGLADNKEKTVRLHTAAHLMLAGLRKILGKHVHQKGSNINEERLRFDFSHPAKLTDEQKQKIEDFVNKVIDKDVKIEVAEMNFAEAKKQKAEGAFEDRYSDRVKVYTIGEYSKEICGGPHAGRTGELGRFKIIKEESSSAGVRRIKAVLE